MSSMENLEAPAEAAPVQAAARVENPKVQRVLVLNRTDLGDDENNASCVAEHYNFLRFLVEQGFSYKAPASGGHGIVYERVKPE